jgi:hypothetical protein
MDGKSLFQKVVNLWLRRRWFNIRSSRTILSLIFFVLSIIGVLSTSGTWRVVSIALLAVTAILLLYEFFFELPSKVYSEARNRIAGLQPLEDAEKFQKDNPAKFINVRLDCLIINKSSPWVSSDIIVSSRLPYAILVKNVHAILWIPTGIQHLRNDLETNAGELIGNISGEVDQQDLKIRVHVKNQDLSENLLSLVGISNCDFLPAVYGTIIVTTKEGKEITLGISEQSVLVVVTKDIIETTNS